MLIGIPHGELSTLCHLTPDWVGYDICTAVWDSRMVPSYKSLYAHKVVPSIMTAGPWSPASSNSTCSCDCYHGPLISQTLLIWVRFPPGWTGNRRVLIDSSQSSEATSSRPCANHGWKFQSHGGLAHWEGASLLTRSSRRLISSVSSLLVLIEEL